MGGERCTNSNRCVRGSGDVCTVLRTCEYPPTYLLTTYLGTLRPDFGVVEYTVSNSQEAGRSMVAACMGHLMSCATLKAQPTRTSGNFRLSLLALSTGSRGSVPVI